MSPISRAALTVALRAAAVDVLPMRIAPVRGRCPQRAWISRLRRVMFGDLTATCCLRATSGSFGAPTGRGVPGGWQLSRIHGPAPARPSMAVEHEPDFAAPSRPRREPSLDHPTGRGRHQRRREPTAVPFGCRRSGATAPARRRRRGTRPAGGTTSPFSRGGDRIGCAAAGSISKFGRRNPVGRAVPSASSKGSAAGRRLYGCAAWEAAVAAQDVIQRIRDGRARTRGRLGD